MLDVVKFDIHDYCAKKVMRTTKQTTKILKEKKKSGYYMYITWLLSRFRPKKPSKSTKTDRVKLNITLNGNKGKSKEKIIWIKYIRKCKIL